jgi:hypothetical protein
MVNPYLVALVLTSGNSTRPVLRRLFALRDALLLLVAVAPPILSHPCLPLSELQTLACWLLLMPRCRHWLTAPSACQIDRCSPSLLPQPAAPAPLRQRQDCYPPPSTTCLMECANNKPRPPSIAAAARGGGHCERSRSGCSCCIIARCCWSVAARPACCCCSPSRPPPALTQDEGSLSPQFDLAL